MNNSNQLDLSINDRPLRVALCGDNKPYLYKNQSGMYDGLDYDIWKTIQDQLNVPCKFIYLDKPNYDEEINNLSNGKYDVLIGNISINSKRSKIVNFTSLEYLDQNRLIYKHDDSNNYYRYLKAFINRAFFPLIIIFLFALLLGYALTINNKNKLFSNVWITLTALLGNTDKVSQKTNISNLVEVFIAVIILIISFFFALFLQGAVTTDIIRIESTNDPFYDLATLNDKNILCLKGTSQSSYLKNMKNKINVKVTDYDYDKFSKRKQNNQFDGNVVSSGIADYYLNNTDKFNGFFVAEESFKAIQDMYPSLRKSGLNLGYDEIAIAIHKNNHDLLEKINQVLSEMKDKEVLPSLCEKYFKDGVTKCIL
jgi:ABC-type amino acid transport substrate-binding protein